ncbi:MAG: hypothetical protein IJ700_02810 [Bacteroidaceae bacterium]|nr:hypothetical protein [Bacteroidaceae bacterium]
MKLKRLLSKLFLILLPLGGGWVAASSCNDIVTYGDDAYVAPENQPNAGAPEIFGVYEVRDVIYDTPLESIDPGQRIRIYGKNLNHVQRLTMGGFEADVTQAATALDYCIAYVPDQFSIPQNGGIEYTTDMGTTTYAITVRAHELELSGLANEFAPAGTTAAVAGRWFAAYGFGTTGHATVTLTTPAVPLTGSAPVGLSDGEGTTLEVVSVTNSGMSIAIPASAPDNSIITFRWLDVAGEQQEYSCHYRPTAYRCFETLNLSAGDSFNDQEGYDLAVSVEPDGIDGIPALGSPILRLSGHAKQWGWYSANIDSELKTPYAIAGQNDYDPTLTRGYTFEFEVMTLAPMPSSADADVNGLTFSMEWGDRVEWSPAAKNEEFSTDGQWQTVRLPLSEVVQRGLRPISWGGTTHFGIILSPIVDNAEHNLRLSNFRIVKTLNENDIVQP